MISFQTFAALVMYPYYHCKYRIRGWGSPPKQRGSTLLIVNHQHDNDDKITVIYSQLHSQWNKKLCVLSGRRMFEAGFMGRQFPWLDWLLGSAATGKLMLALGMVPIENEIRSRALVAFARAIAERHGDLPLAQVFREDVIAQLPPDVQSKNLSALEGAGARKAGARIVTVRALREPYRDELLDQMRAEVEQDLTRLEQRLSAGETVWMTPEGHQSRNGAMKRMRTALWRILPFARDVYLIAISYDVFVGRRLSMLMRVVPPADRSDLVSSLKAARPVTVSQLIADWLERAMQSRPLEAGAMQSRALERGSIPQSRPLEAGADSTFSYDDAFNAVQTALASLPPAAWVEPELRASPARMTRAAIDGMARLGILARTGDRYRLTDKRRNPNFPDVADMVSFQAVFFRETIDGLAQLAERAKPRAAVPS